jgi:hypothetical protein
VFVDESRPLYEPNSQPTGTYKNDFRFFLDLYLNDVTRLTNANVPVEGFDYFKGIVYPILKSNTVSFAQHAVWALYGRSLTEEEAEKICSSLPLLSGLKSSFLGGNPYTAEALGLEPGTPSGLLHYGWKGVFDKQSPASAVFTSETFAEELNDLLNN